MTLVLIGKDFVLEGSTTKIEAKQVPGIYIYIGILRYGDLTRAFGQRLAPKLEGPGNLQCYTPKKLDNW